MRSKGLPADQHRIDYGLELGRQGTERRFGPHDHIIIRCKVIAGRSHLGNRIDIGWIFLNTGNAQFRVTCDLIVPIACLPMAVPKSQEEGDSRGDTGPTTRSPPLGLYRVRVTEANRTTEVEWLPSIGPTSSTGWDHPGPRFETKVGQPICE